MTRQGTSGDGQQPDTVHRRSGGWSGHHRLVAQPHRADEGAIAAAEATAAATVTPDHPMGSAVWSITGFPIYESHNGALEVFIQLGLCGLLLVALVLIAASISSVRTIARGADRCDRWPLVSLVAVVVSNLSEARVTSLLGIALTAVTFYAARIVVKSAVRGTGRGVGGAGEPKQVGVRSSD